VNGKVVYSKLSVGTFPNFEKLTDLVEEYLSTENWESASAKVGDIAGTRECIIL